MLLILTFFNFIWFIDSVSYWSLCFILILKEKISKFSHLTLILSLIFKEAHLSNLRRPLIKAAPNSFKF